MHVVVAFDGLEYAGAGRRRHFHRNIPVQYVQHICQILGIEGYLGVFAFDCCAELTFVVSRPPRRGMILSGVRERPLRRPAICRRMMPLPSRANMAAVRVARRNSSEFNTTRVV